jgi:hypothetical protein
VTPDLELQVFLVVRIIHGLRDVVYQSPDLVSDLVSQSSIVCAWSTYTYVYSLTVGFYIYYRMVLADIPEHPKVVASHLISLLLNNLK